MAEAWACLEARGLIIPAADLNVRNGFRILSPLTTGQQYFSASNFGLIEVKRPGIVVSSVLVRQKKGRHTAVGFCDDPDLYVSGERVRGQQTPSVLEAKFILTTVVLVHISPISGDVVDEELFLTKSNSWRDNDLLECMVMSDEGLTYAQSVMLKQWRQPTGLKTSNRTNNS